MKFRRFNLDPFSEGDRLAVLQAFGLHLFEFRFIEKRGQLSLIDSVWQSTELLPSSLFTAQALALFPVVSIQQSNNFLAEPISKLSLWEELFPYPLGAVVPDERAITSSTLSIQPPSAAVALLELSQELSFFERRVSSRELVVLHVKSAWENRKIVIQFHRGKRLAVGTHPILTKLVDETRDPFLFSQRVREFTGLSAALFTLELSPSSKVFSDLKHAFQSMRFLDRPLSQESSQPPEVA